MNELTATMPRAKAPRTIGLLHPLVGPSMTPKSSEPRATIDSAAPTRSSLGADGSFDSGTRKYPATSAMAPIGRLTQNTELQEKCCSRMPPITGPVATPSPEQPAQMAIARPRSFGSRKTLVRIDSVEGMIIAPPAPIDH